jgi:predicted RND superfamily exporter protein
VITSVVVAGGLALNWFSSFPPLQLLGLLGSSVLLLALLANLLVLPALIVVIGRR